jgi:hypothetical protein
LERHLVRDAAWCDSLDDQQKPVLAALLFDET